MWLGQARWKEASARCRRRRDHGAEAHQEYAGPGSGAPAEYAGGVGPAETATAPVTDTHGERVDHAWWRSPRIALGDGRTTSIVLAIASTIGWLINALFGGLDFLTKRLAPVFPARPSPRRSTWRPAPNGSSASPSYRAKVFPRSGTGPDGLAQGRPARAGAGVPGPRLVYRRGVSAAVSGPLTRMANAFSFVIDAKIVDGAVNGIGRADHRDGKTAAPVQTGYVRNYALGIGTSAPP